MIKALPSQPSFRDYIMHRRVTDTPQGDFTADAQSDRTFPHAREWSQVEGYLRHKPHVCREAIEAGRLVWNGYIGFLTGCYKFHYNKKPMTIDGVPIVKRVG